MRPTGIGIIGCGRIGERHAEAYSSMEYAKLIGFADVDRSRSATLASRFSVEDFASAEELIMDDAVEAISICTPNMLHTDYAIAAVEAGKHILVEKPLATTVADCEKITKAAEKAGVVAMVGHTHRFYPSNRAVKKLLDEGRVGRLRAIQDYSLDPGFIAGKGQPSAWTRDRELGGGMIMDTVHAADRLRWWTGEEIIEVEAVMSDQIRPDSKTEEMLMAIFKMTNGVAANLVSIAPSWGVGDSQTRFIGTGGVMYMRYGEEVRVGSSKWESIDFAYRNSPPSFEHNMAGFREEMKSFLRSIAEGRRPEVTLRDGTLAVRAVIAIYESIRSEKGVRI
jgi:predicted dehydrogenase